MRPGAGAVGVVHRRRDLGGEFPRPMDRGERRKGGATDRRRYRRGADPKDTAKRMKMTTMLEKEGEKNTTMSTGIMTHIRETLYSNKLT